MLTGWQRSCLKKDGHKLNSLVQIGKEGLTEDVISHIDSMLEDNELLKLTFLKSCIIDTKEGANIVCNKVGAEFIQAIGRKFVIFRQARDKDKQKITIPEK
jgi:RNA-binding protein